MARQSCFPIRLGAMAIALTLAACGGGDPEERSLALSEDASTAWSQAKDETDLSRRLAGYRDAMETAERIVERFPETTAGSRLASGASYNSIELANWQEEIERLDAALPCIEAPTAQCLTPLSRQPVGVPGTFRHRNPQLQPAVDRACTGDEAAALAELARFEANPVNYRDNLIQTAVAAGHCGQDGIIPSLVERAIAADTSRGNQAVQFRAGLLQQLELRPASAIVATAVEQAIADEDGVTDQVAASALLAAARGYARHGEGEKARAAFLTVQDDMNFNVTRNRSDITIALLAGGAGDVAVQEPFRFDIIQRASVDGTNMNVRKALVSLSVEAGLNGASAADRLADRYHQGFDDVAFGLDPEHVLAAMARSPKRESLRAKVASFESALDVIALQNPTMSDRNFGSLKDYYAHLALIELRLGQPERAESLADKARALPTQGVSATTLQHMPYYLLATGDLAGAIDASTSGVGATSGYLDGVFSIAAIRAFGKAGDRTGGLAAIQALSESNSSVSAHHLNHALIDGLIEASALEDAEALLLAQNLSRGNSPAIGSYVALLRAHAANGDMDNVNRIRGAGFVADTEFMTVPAAFAVAEGAVASGDERVARDALDTALEIAITASRTRDGVLGDGYFRAKRPTFSVLHEPAQIAFAGGMTELGLDLYRRAGSTTATPLITAAKTRADQELHTALLSAAYDGGDEILGQTAWGVLEGLSASSGVAER